MCLLCQVSLPHFKVSNLKRHYESNDCSFSQVSCWLELRGTKILPFKAKLNNRTNVMPKFAKDTDVTTEVGFNMVFNIARAKLPYIEDTALPS